MYPFAMNRTTPPARATTSIAVSSLTLMGTLIGTLMGTLPGCGDNLEGVPGEILPYADYAARCEKPRSGTDAVTGDAFADTAGSLLDEQLWIRSWTDDTYLRYRDVPSLDPKTFSTAVDYFDKLKSGVITPSGKPRDNFHFSLATADWEAMSQSGVEAGYGIEWALLANKPPRSLVIAFVQPGSQAAMPPASLDRGAKVITIDGIDVQNGSDVDTLNEGLFPSHLNAPHSFVVIDRGATTPRTVTLMSTSINIVPVQNAHPLPAPNDKVGYLLFTDHIATAEKGLVDAVNTLKTAGVTDLILDIRYNGGGYLDIASELAYMIAGPSRTAGKTFERLQFNDRYPDTDPFSGFPLEPEGFVNQSLGFVRSRLTSGLPLPALGLSRVFVLTSVATCSASESVMNSLAGIDVQVIQIGETTCGKPYGFVPQDNCGTTFFAIQFQGVNNKGFGSYADGFQPGGVFKGCTVPDDFTHMLGDPAEARLTAALAYRASATCPQTAARLADPLAAVSGAVIPKPDWRQNRIVRR
jgi:C-terminal processing protease CtpA/Prc